MNQNYPLYRFFHHQHHHHFHRRLMAVIFLFVIFLFSATPLHAEIYKWVDEDGNIHFGDKPGDEVKTDKVELEPLNTTGQLHQQNQQLDRLLEQADMAEKRMQDKKAQKALVASQAKADKANRLRRCFEAHKVLTLLQLQMPIYRDDSGQFNPHWMHDRTPTERQYIEDSERDRVIQDNQALVAESCSEAQDQEASNAAILHWQMEKSCSDKRGAYDAIVGSKTRTPLRDIEAKKSSQRQCL